MGVAMPPTMGRLLQSNFKFQWTHHALKFLWTFLSPTPKTSSPLIPTRLPPYYHWLVCCYGNEQQTISLGLVEVFSLRFPLSQNVMSSLLPSQLKSHSVSECAIYMIHLAQEMTETSKLSTLTPHAPGGHNKVLLLCLTFSQALGLRKAQWI